VATTGAPQTADVDCNGSIDALDALQVLRQVAGLGSSPAGCAAQAGLSIAQAARVWGDMDCDGDADAIDAMRILRYAAGLANLLPPGCV
jgi:hypothetical protein